MSQHKRYGLFGLLLVGGALLTACQGQQPETAGQGDEVVEPQQAAGEAAPMQKKERGERGHGFAHGGPLSLLTASLDDIDLSADQRAAVEQQLSALPAPGHDEDHGALRQALAAAVRSGNVDLGALSAEIDAVNAKQGERHQAMAGAVQALHDLLTPAQRAELVANIQELVAAGPMDGGERCGKPGVDGPRRERPGGERPRHARPDGERPQRADGERRPRGERGPDGDFDHRAGMGMGHGPGAKGPMMGMLRGIELTAEQRDQMKAAFGAARPERPDPAAMKERFEARGEEMKKLLASFAEDSFDAKAALGAMAPMAEPREHVEGMVELVQALVPVLDATQRETLAKNIEAGPLEPMHGKGPMHGKNAGPGRGRFGRGAPQE